MTNRQLKSNVESLCQLQAQIDALGKEADKLKASIQKEMERRAVDELQAGDVLVRWKEVTTHRVDTNAFKAQYSALYAQLVKPSTTRRFTVRMA